MNMRFFVAVLILGVVGSSDARVVDGIAATVNGQVILKSDLEEAVRYEAFMGDKSQITFALRNSSLDRLIDQELLRQQMRVAVPVSTKEIDHQITELRKLHGVATEREWTALLRDAGLTEDELRRRIGMQIQLTRLVDERLRPSANISSKSIANYYSAQLLPRLRQSGAKEVPLADVSAEIKELLIQQRINELLVAWLQNLRSGSEIRIVFQGSGEAGQSP